MDRCACIIQDSVSDWEIQSAKMGDIYANAHVTLAASSADSVHKHILSPRDAKWRGVGFEISGTGSVLAEDRLCHGTHLEERSDLLPEEHGRCKSGSCLLESLHIPMQR
jgi:hypothetical protein